MSQHSSGTVVRALALLGIAATAMAATACGSHSAEPPPDVSIAVSPTRSAVTTSQTQIFTATVAGSNETRVTWEIDNRPGGDALVGVIDASGKYTPPSNGGVHAVTARSVANPAKTASSTVAVTDLAGVLTYHNDLSRDGANTGEYALTPSAVTTATFGKLFSCSVDGAIYAQPLWVPNLTMNGGKHNTVFVATQHDSVYAFDADASPCVTLWHANLLDSVHGAGPGELTVPSSGPNSVVGNGSGVIDPEVGITGTPVIDLTTNTLYVVAKSYTTDLTFYQRLHAINLLTGNDRVPARSIDRSIVVPGTGDESVSGQVAFNPRTHLQRAGLALLNGVVYVAWASHEDADPYHGWLIGFDAATLAPRPNAVFNTTPNQVATYPYSRGGIWMGGAAPAADSDGNLFLNTGNGTFDADQGGSNYGDTFLKLSTNNGLAVADWFTPANEADLDTNDLDLGSSGATFLLDPLGTGHFAVCGGKEGKLFVINRDNMGRRSSPDQVLQTIDMGNAIFSTGAFWNNTLYMAAIGPLQAFSFNPAIGQFDVTSTSQTSGFFQYPGLSVSVSSSDTSNGIVWAIDANRFVPPGTGNSGPAVLYAYDATNLGVELWDSGQAANGRDLPGYAVKFSVPTIANGKVYIGTRGELDVYGLLLN